MADDEEIARVEGVAQTLLSHLVEAGFPVTQATLDDHPGLWGCEGIERPIHVATTQKVKARDQAQRLDGEWSHPEPQSKPRF